MSQNLIKPMGNWWFWAAQNARSCQLGSSPDSSSFILHPSFTSFILHPSSFILDSSSFIRWRMKNEERDSSFFIRWRIPQFWGGGLGMKPASGLAEVTTPWKVNEPAWGGGNNKTGAGSSLPVIERMFWIQNVSNTLVSGYLMIRKSRNTRRCFRISMVTRSEQSFYTFGNPAIQEMKSKRKR